MPARGASARGVDSAEMEARLVEKRSETTGEYYIMGRVPRVGVYSLTNRKITMKQAIVSAGGPEKELGDSRTYISVLRRNGEQENYVVENARFSDLLDGTQKDIYLKPNDIVRVTEAPMQTHPATAPSRTYSMAKARAIRPRVAPSAFRMTDS